MDIFETHSKASTSLCAMYLEVGRAGLRRSSNGLEHMSAECFTPDTVVSTLKQVLPSEEWPRVT